MVTGHGCFLVPDARRANRADADSCRSDAGAVGRACRYRRDVARIEVGQRRPTLDVLAELADSLGVPVHRLLADERSVRAAEGQEAFGKSARQLNSVILELDDADIEILLKVANRLKR